MAKLTGKVQGQTTDAGVDVTSLLDEQLHNCHVVVDDSALEQREAVPVDHSEHIPHLSKHDGCGNNCRHSLFMVTLQHIKFIFLRLINLKYRPLSVQII